MRLAETAILLQLQMVFDIFPNMLDRQHYRVNSAVSVVDTLCNVLHILALFLLTFDYVSCVDRPTNQLLGMVVSNICVLQIKYSSAY